MSLLQPYEIVPQSNLGNAFLFCSMNTVYLILILVFILSEVLIFISGDRTAFFYINLSAIFIILFSQNLLKLRLITVTSSILIIIIISYFNPTAKHRVIDQTINQMNLLDKNKRDRDGIYIFSKEHTHHYITAYRMFLDNKIIGVGVKNFRNFCGNKEYEFSKTSCSTHPHNTFLQILTETGIIGFIFLLIIFFIFCRYILYHLILRFKKKYYFTDFEICILSGILIYLWPIVPTGSIFNNWLNILMILNIPFLIWSRKFNKI